MKRLPAVLLAANVLYLIAVRSIAGRFVSVVGCLVALALLVGPRASRRFAARVEEAFQASSGRAALLPAVAFALPAIAFVRPFTLGFWRVDAAAWLIVAWLITLVWLAIAQRPAIRSVPDEAHHRLPLLTLLFIGWTALFWLTLVWDVGVSRVALELSREDRLLASFRLWETRPASEHLFLIWPWRDYFAQHLAYTNHLYPFAFLVYGSSKLIVLATGLPLYVGRNLFPFVMVPFGVTAFAMALARTRLGDRPAGLKFYATLFLAMGFFISEWHYWDYLYSINFDSLFPLIAYLTAIVWASAQPQISEDNARPLMASAIAFGAFGWVYVPLIVVALWFYYGRLRQTIARTVRHNKVLVKASAVIVGVGAINYAVPRVFVWLKGYSTFNSTFAYRAGLDGDTRYFQNVIQAILQPYCCEPRTWASLLPFVPLLLCVTYLGGGKKILRYQVLKQFVFLSSPYFFSLALFPQSVSIHPYLYDQLLFLPVALMGGTWSLSAPVQRRLRGPYVLAGLLLLGTVIMSNFVTIAQSLQRPSRLAF